MSCPTACRTRVQGDCSTEYSFLSISIGSMEQTDGRGGPILFVRALPHANTHLQPLRPWPDLLFWDLFANGPPCFSARCGPALSKESPRTFRPCPAHARISRPKEESDASRFTSTFSRCSTGGGLGGNRNIKASCLHIIDHPGMALSFLRLSMLGVRAIRLSTWPPCPGTRPPTGATTTWRQE